MSEKLFPRIAIGTALLGATVLAASKMENDRSAHPERGNNPAAVARFDEALQGNISQPLPENSSDIKVEVGIPYTVQPHDNANKIFEAHATPGDNREVDVANIQAQGSGPGNMLMAGDRITLTGDLVDLAPQPNPDGAIPADSHQYGE